MLVVSLQRNLWYCFLIFFQFCRALPSLQNFQNQWKPVRQLQKRPSQRPGKKCLLSMCATPVFLDSCAATARGCTEQESKLCLLLAETVFWEYKRNVMKYSDLHLKENQELHSCFLCLRIGPGMWQQQTLSTDSQECPKMFRPLFSSIHHPNLTTTTSLSYLLLPWPH